MKISFCVIATILLGCVSEGWAADQVEGGKDSGKKHTDPRIKPRLVIMKALGVVPMAPAFG